MLGPAVSETLYPFPAAPLRGEPMGYAKFRSLKTKEHVFCEGDPRSHVFQVESGAVALYKTLNDGRRQIVDFAYPGDLIGLGALDEHVLSAQTTCETRVRVYSASALERQAEEDAGLALRLYKSVSRELTASRDLLVSVGQRTAIERIALFLLLLHRRQGKDKQDLRLDMLRSDIADMLGLTIETVSRNLTKMRNAGVIDILRSGNVVRICDMTRLRAMAGE